MDTLVHKMKEYNIEELVGTLDFERNKLKKTKHNLFLTTHEIEILDKYHIAYNRYHTAKELLQEINYKIPYLEEEEIEELDEVSMSIAERDYSQNTRK